MDPLSLLPGPLRRAVKSLRIRRRLRHLRNRISGVGGGLSSEDLARDLRGLGLREGDVVLVHSSLSRLGMVDGGPATVVDALRRAVGPEGTIAVSTIHLSVPAVEHFRSDPVFDVRETPSRAGAIGEVFRTTVGSSRSLHPTHSVSAAGPKAEFLTSSHHESDRPFGPTSPYERLEELGGKVLLLGVTLASMTNFHVVEDRIGDRFPYPVYLPEPVRARCVDAGGTERTVISRIHNPEMSALRQCDDLEPELLRRGVIRVGQVGQGRSILVEAAALTNAMEELAAEGVTIYTPDGVPVESLIRKKD